MTSRSACSPRIASSTRNRLRPSNGRSSISSSWPRRPTCQRSIPRPSCRNNGGPPRRCNKSQYLLLQCVRSLLAHRDVSLRCTDWVAIGSIATMPRASRAGRFGENDPTWTFEFGVPLLRCSGSLTLHQDTEGPHVLSSDFAVHAEPEEFRDLSRQG